MLVGYLFRQAHVVAAVVVMGCMGLVQAGEPRSPKYDALAVQTSPTPRPSTSPTASPPTKLAAKPQGRVAGVAFAAGPGWLAGRRLYVEPNSRAAVQAQEWRATRPVDAARMERMAAQPQAHWFGDWLPQPRAEAARLVAAAEAAGAVPVLVAYNLPGLDCGGYSAGGATDAVAYRAWTDQLAVGIGGRPAVVVLEPDALAELDCFTPAQQGVVTGLLSYAVNRFKANPATAVYIDAGNTRWQSAAVMARRLNAAGISRADGFSLNVSNFITTNESAAYGGQISALTGGKHYVIDTSRNGAGYSGAWCNPPGRALGAAPTTRTGNPLADAYLWIKSPGESDGECGRGEPEAGAWWADYALDLAVRAGY